jgi:germination protein M
VRALLLLGLLAAVLAGCGGDDAPSDTPRGAVSARQQVVVYFLRGGRVTPVARSIPRTRSVGAAALEELFAGPGDDETVRTAVPAGTRLEGLDIADGTATVDLSGELGAAATAQVVHTLTRFDSVQRVDLRPGRSGLDRTAVERHAPAILVESPLPGDSAGSPLRVRGTSNTFEATFLLELHAGRRRLARQVVTATSGSGTRGTFDVSLDHPASEGRPLRLTAYEQSAEDGRPVNRVTLGLRAR